MKKRTRANVRCVAISGERDGQSINMKVQTVEGRNLSPETISALLNIGAAAMKYLGQDPGPDPELPPALPPPRKRAKRKV